MIPEPLNMTNPTLEARAKLSDWLAFSASCIKSGEAWSATCEAMHDDAKQALSLLSPNPDSRTGAGDRCPTCNSRDPHRHPAMQFEGEIEICPDAFHLLETLQNRPEYIAAVKAKRAALASPAPGRDEEGVG